MENKDKNSLGKALLVSTALISLNVLDAPQAQAVTATGTMSAIILAPITLSVTNTGLHFGSMTETANGTMVVDTAGLRTPGGGVSGVVGLGLEKQANLEVSGATGVNITISMTAATFTVDDVGAGAPMNVNAFNIGTNAAGDNVIVTLPASPTVFGIGGTLNVVSPQLPGTYTGNFTVNAQYQ